MKLLGRKLSIQIKLFQNLTNSSWKHFGLTASLQRVFNCAFQLRCRGYGSHREGVGGQKCWSKKNVKLLGRKLSQQIKLFQNLTNGFWNHFGPTASLQPVVIYALQLRCKGYNSHREEVKTSKMPIKKCEIIGQKIVTTD